MKIGPGGLKTPKPIRGTVIRAVSISNALTSLYSRVIRSILPRQYTNTSVQHLHLCHGVTGPPIFPQARDVEQRSAHSSDAGHENDRARSPRSSFADETRESDDAPPIRTVHSGCVDLWTNVRRTSIRTDRRNARSSRPQCLEENGSTMTCSNLTYLTDRPLSLGFALQLSHLPPDDSEERIVAAHI